ncbi:MAG: flagellar basal-body rod protein FlgG, partial [Thalassobaculaceae bacterium]
MQSLSIAATGMLAQQLNVEVISNNIANMNTTGYKRQRAEFQDLLYQDQRRVGTTSSAAGTVVPTGIQLGIGVSAAATYRISSQGAMTKTDNQMDLAIRGQGYFQIELPDGQLAYTRAGAFQIGPTGNIVNQDGFAVQPGIAIPAEATAVSINAQGQVLAKLDGQVAETNLGQLQLAIFQNEAGLENIGNNLLLETEASGAPTLGTPDSNGYGTLLQGFVENSNVDPVQEITSMITAQRAYELNSKVIETSDQMMQSANNVR